MKTFVVGDIHGRCAQLLNLLDMLPRDPEKDTLVFLGDLIDRGADAPGCVSHILKLCRENPQRVICLRGNHEQMLMDFLEGRSNLWLTPVAGGERTFEQYTGQSVRVDSEKDLEEMRLMFEQSFPAEHLAFMQDLPFYYEDEHAIYVHAGLDEGKHPSESSPILAVVDARHGFLQKLPRQALRVWTYADAFAAVARKVGPAWDLHFSQCGWSRYRLQPPVAAKLSFASGFQSLSEFR